MNRVIVACSVSFFVLISEATALQSDQFTFNGSLARPDAAIVGTADIAFELFDAETGGNAIGAPVVLQNLPIDGKPFTVDLSFPNSFTDAQRWLQLTVDGEPLDPRQAIDGVPIAQHAIVGGIAGPPGSRGPVGPAGPVGPEGAQGLQGIEGVPGPVGSSGVNGAVPTVSLNGPIGIFPPHATSFRFASTTMLVGTSAPNQKLTGIASAILATSSGTDLVDFGLCYEGADNVINPFAGTNVQTGAVDTLRKPFMTAMSVTLQQADNYAIGFCARNRGATPIDLAQNVNGYVQVTN